MPLSTPAGISSNHIGERKSNSANRCLVLMAKTVYQYVSTQYFIYEQCLCENLATI